MLSSWKKIFLRSPHHPKINICIVTLDSQLAWGVLHCNEIIITIKQRSIKDLVEVLTSGVTITVLLNINLLQSILCEMKN